MDQKSLLGLGEYLRGEREKRHITIEQVASATKINIKLLHALESDNYDSLPAKPFVRGFVTSYTRYVGLDHREVLARFDLFLDEKSGQKFERPENAPHIFVEREGQTENSKTALTLVMVSFLVAAVVIFALKPSLRHHHGRGKDKAVVSNDEIITVVPPPGDGSPITVKPQQPTTVAKTPDASSAEAPTLLPETQVAESKTPESKPAENKTVESKAKEPIKPPAPVEVVTPGASPQVTAAKPTPASTATPAAASHTASEKPQAKPGAPATIKLPPIPSSEVRYRLVVRALDDAWVKYQVDDRPVQQYTLRKDKVIWVRARNSLRFTSAKPSALEISYDNKDFKPLGSTAKIIILPKDAEAQYKSAPFVDPNPAYLSTPNQ